MSFGIRRLRPINCLLPAFVSSWVFFTYYLAFYQPASPPPSYPLPAEKSAAALSEKLQNFERIVQKQIKENERLLNEISEQRDKFVQPKNKEITTLLPVVAGVVTKQDLGIDIKKPAYPARSTDFSQTKIAILVIACNRSLAIKNLLDQLFKYRPKADQFPIYVSHDCDDKETQAVIESYGNDHLTYMRHPDQSSIKIDDAKQKKFIGYYKLARHYKWALNRTFYDFKHEMVIIVEDDLDIAVDFFEYFLAGSRLLTLDPTLWCVSAWNDNGKTSLIDLDRPDLLYRTDFFGGLGWLLTKTLWDELVTQWPPAFWDDWMREASQRKNRSCIRPEISRTSMSPYGKKGVSKGLYYENHLKQIKLNEKFTNFTQLDLTYLLKDNFDEPFVKQAFSAPLITQAQLMNTASEDPKFPRTVRIMYKSTDQPKFKLLCKALGIMDDAKDGVPRMAYRGIVPFMFKGVRVFLTPEADWKRYDESWR